MSEAERCRHGVYDTDCFECYPDKPAMKPEMPERVWISSSELKTGINKSYPLSTRWGIGISLAPQRAHDSLDDSIPFVPESLAEQLRAENERLRKAIKLMIAQAGAAEPLASCVLVINTGKAALSRDRG